MALHQKAFGDPALNQTLTDIFQELLAKGWLTLVDTVEVYGPTGYFLLFMTKQEKSSVENDGTATHKSIFL